MTQNKNQFKWAKTIQIGDQVVGSGNSIYFIAEAGVNHNGDLSMAKKLVDAAANAGANAVKFQTFNPESLNTPSAPKAAYHIETTGSDSNQSWLDLLKTQVLDRGMHEVLIDYSKKVGIHFLSTPYDIESLDMLCALKVPAIKVASTDLNNHPFLVEMAERDVPIILSTAMSDFSEVNDSVNLLYNSGCRELVVMQCTGNYPSKLSDTNMRVMEMFKENCGVLVGYSDHTLEDVNPILSVGLGACVFEKHITLDQTLPGPDHRMALTPEELKKTIHLIREAEKALGRREKVVLPSETETRARLRKSIVAVCDIEPGTIIEDSFLTLKRPGTGIAPQYLKEILGRKTKNRLSKDALLSWDDFL